MQFGESPKIRSDISPPSSRSKSKLKMVIIFYQTTRLPIPYVINFIYFLFEVILGVFCIKQNTKNMYLIVENAMVTVRTTCFNLKQTVHLFMIPRIFSK
jgi:hypothetical protein